jgi:hypothetical protein
VIQAAGEFPCLWVGGGLLYVAADDVHSQIRRLHAVVPGGRGQRDGTGQVCERVRVNTIEANVERWRS